MNHDIHTEHHHFPPWTHYGVEDPLGSRSEILHQVNRTWACKNNTASFFWWNIQHIFGQEMRVIYCIIILHNNYNTTMDKKTHIVIL